MVERLSVLLLLAFTSLNIQAQSARADSVMQVVLNALTLKEHKTNGNLDSILTSGTWEALAYWDMNTPATTESLQEAVGDRYQFSDGRFNIDFIDPENPRQIGLSISGYFVRRGYIIEMFKQINSRKETIEIWYADERYLVIESDRLRIFLTHESSYYLED